MTDGDAERGLPGPGAEQAAEVAPESRQGCRRFFGLDGQGWFQIVGAIVLGLIVLYSSYDHINVLGRVTSLDQQPGIGLIAVSLAVVVVVAQGFCAAVAQLASGSRLRAENEAAEARVRAAEVPERQAEGAQRQGQGIALLRGAALLTARVQLDPSELNPTKLTAFLSLLAEQAFLDQQGPES